MSKFFEQNSLERIVLQMASSLDLQAVLTTVTEGLVDELDAAFARIWLVGPGDLCAKCHKVELCQNRDRCLHLKASSGMYTNLNGEYRRVPLGALKIGWIGKERKAIVTSNTMQDKRLPNKTWLKENKLRSFAGYPLILEDELLGVLGLFSQHVMTDEQFERLAIFANLAAVAIKNADLFQTVERLKGQLQAENIYLQEEIKLQHNFEQIISQSEALKKVLYQVEQVAATGATVLILGETGTGKELIARALHHISDRKNRPLVKVNCAALPANLIESELFGHEKGAFTGALTSKPGRFELANGGTIFLDEIGDLALDLQAKLLRVLQEGEFERVGGTKTIKVDVRALAATNRHLKQSVETGEFREDLYYRLNVFPITLPALRERREDVPLLTMHFVKKFSAKLGKVIDKVPNKTIQSLQSYDWPGNVRELENIIERAVILARDATLAIDEVLEIVENPKSPAPKQGTLKQVERAYILTVLEDCDWRIQGQAGAAERLGLDPGTLRSRLRRLGIKRPQ